ncbi:MAG: Panacea domain-containing protein [Clostridium sp.]
MYPVMTIARYTINKCIDLDRSISNLQLQKILYYIQGECMRKGLEDGVFSEDIIAWQYGPVVPEVYYEYNNYSSSNINNIQDCDVVEETIQNIINPVIEEKSKLSAWKLVEQTHNEHPWKSSYIEGEYNKITKKTMREFFS